MVSKLLVWRKKTVVDILNISTTFSSSNKHFKKEKIVKGLAKDVQFRNCTCTFAYTCMCIYTFVVTSQHTYRLMPVPLCSTYILHGGGGEFNSDL